MSPIRVSILDTGSGSVDRIVDILVAAGVEVVARGPDIATLTQSLTAAGPDVVLVDAARADLIRGLHPEPAEPKTPSPLSPREAEVLRLLGSGMQVRAIGRQLGISVHTVRGHVKKILAKLGCHSQLEAVVRSSAAGWLNPPGVG